LEAHPLAACRSAASAAERWVEEVEATGELREEPEAA